MATIQDYAGRFGLDRLLSRDLLDALRMLRFEPGRFLIREGDPADSLMFLVDGRVKVFHQMENGKSLLICFYSPFAMLGDAELFACDRYLNDVQALADAVCLRLPAEAVRRSAGRNGPLLAHMCGFLGRKLASFNATSAINLRYPVENRLASYLVALGEGGAGAERASGDYGTDDQGELADIIGTSYRQLSRAIAKLKREGILEPVRGRIRIASRERLAALAKDLYLDSSDPKGRQRR